MRARSVGAIFIVLVVGFVAVSCGGDDADATPAGASAVTVTVGQQPEGGDSVEGAAFREDLRAAAREYPDWADLGYDFCIENPISKGEIRQFAERTWDWAIEQGFEPVAEEVTSAAVHGCLAALDDQPRP